MRSPRSEQGFILPMALGIGLIMVLLGVLIVNRSLQNRIASAAQTETSQSLAVAESGIAQFQSLLNRYPSLAIYCSKKSVDSTLCNRAKDWQNIAEPDLTTCPAVSTEASDLAKDYANDIDQDTWQSITNTPSEGQFRLVSYLYRPDDTSQDPPEAPGTGELVMEGRVNGADSLRTSTTRLGIKFRLENTPGIANPPGLWIGSHHSTEVTSSTQLNTNVRDATCLDSLDVAQVNKIKERQQPLGTYNYKLTPGEPFAQFPPLESSLYTINTIDKATETLPRAGDTAQEGVLSYDVGQDGEGKSITLATGATLNIGTGNETVVLHLEGGMSMSDHSRIKLAAGSKLIIHARGPVNVSGDSTDPLIEQLATPAVATNVQIYVHPPVSPNPPHTVTFKGGSGMSLFLFAPESSVTFGSTAKVKGTIWAQSWKDLDSAELEEAQTNLAEVNLIFPPRISPLKSWQRLP